MKRLALCVWLIFAAGCGGADGTGPGSGMHVDPLVQKVEGSWIYVGTTGAVGVNLGADATYSVAIVQAVTATTANLQLEKGIYSLTASSLVLAPQQSTCPGAHPAYRYDYAAAAASLTLSYSGGATVFVRNSSPATSIDATYGCFSTDGTGTFTASPLTPVN